MLIHLRNVMIIDTISLISTPSARKMIYNVALKWVNLGIVAFTLQGVSKEQDRENRIGVLFTVQSRYVVFTMMKHLLWICRCYISGSMGLPLLGAEGS